MAHPTRLKEDPPPLAGVKLIARQGVLVRRRLNERKHHLNERVPYRQKRASMQFVTSDTKATNL